MKNKEVLTREMLLRSEIFWMELIRNQIFNEVHSYMTENNLTRQELANRLGYSKGYVSQILNGNSNLSFQKLTELALAINKVPYLYLKDIDEVLEKDRDGQSIFIDFKELEQKSERCDFLKNREIKLETHTPTPHS